MGVDRFAVLAEPVVGDFKGGSGGKHGVGEDEGLAGEVRRTCIFDVYMEVISLVVFAVCRYESILCIVKEIQYALMQRQSSTEDGGHDDSVVICRYVRYSERGTYILDRIVQGLADFVSKDFPDPLKISAESHVVLLDILVPHLGHEAVED